MNKEEIEEIETLKIDFKDTDELELALEVSSKKAIYLIDNLIKSLFELQQENQELKTRIKEALNVLEEKQRIYSDEERIKQLEQENSIEGVMEILRGNY